MSRGVTLVVAMLAVRLTSWYNLAATIVTWAWQ